MKKLVLIFILLSSTSLWSAKTGTYDCYGIHFISGKWKTDKEYLAKVTINETPKIGGTFFLNSLPLKITEISAHIKGEYKNDNYGAKVTLDQATSRLFSEQIYDDGSSVFYGYVCEFTQIK